MLTVFLTSRAGAAVASGAPQNPQSRNRGGFSSPQFAQIATGGFYFENVKRTEDRAGSCSLDEYLKGSRGVSHTDAAVAARAPRLTGIRERAFTMIFVRPFQSRRRRLLSLGLAAFAAAAAISTAASGDTSGTNPCPPGGQARQFCVAITDTDKVSTSPDPASGKPASYMRYVVTITNYDQNKLTHVRLTTQLSDRTPSGSVASTARLVSVDSTTPGACSETSPGTTVCDAGSLPANSQPFVATFFYSTSSTSGVTATVMDATVSVDEHSSDQGQPLDPVQETQTAQNATEYESSDASAATVVPPGQERKLDLNTSTSDLTFTTPGTHFFIASVEESANDTGHCFTGVPCLAQTTFSDVSGGADLFSSANWLTWFRRILNPPTGVNANNIDALHFYDAVPVTADAAADRFTSTTKSFVGIDGVRFPSAPAPLQPNVNYFVVNATATTFQVSATKGGKPIDLTAGGSYSAQRIRIIGDAKAERWSPCTATPPSVPAICAVQISKTEIDEWVADSENGWMK